MRFLILFCFSMSAYSETMVAVNPGQYSDKENMIIEALTGSKDQTDGVAFVKDEKFDKLNSMFNDKKRTYVPTIERKDQFNPNMSIARDDQQIMNVKVSPDDVINTKMCYQVPLRVSFGNINDKIQDIVMDNNDLFDKNLSKDARSAVVLLKRRIQGDGEFQTAIRFIRNRDGRAYVVNIFAESCEGKTELNYPKEIILNEARFLTSLEEKVLSASDLITDLTEGFDRRNNENIIDIYDGIITPGSEYSLLSFSIKVGNIDRKKMSLTFDFLDSLQVQRIESKTELIKKSTIKVSRKNKHPILRFKSMVKINKRYVLEKKFLYLAITDLSGRYYQYVKIPVKDLFERKKLEGFDLN